MAEPEEIVEIVEAIDEAVSPDETPVEVEDSSTDVVIINEAPVEPTAEELTTAGILAALMTKMDNLSSIVAQLSDRASHTEYVAREAADKVEDIADEIAGDIEPEIIEDLEDDVEPESAKPHWMFRSYKDWKDKK